MGDQPVVYTLRYNTIRVQSLQSRRGTATNGDEDGAFRCISLPLELQDLKPLTFNTNTILRTTDGELAYWYSKTSLSISM